MSGSGGEPDVGSGISAIWRAAGVWPAMPPTLPQLLQGRHVMAFVTCERSDRLLDYGCGNGFFAGRLARRCAAVEAVDITDVAVLARRYKHLANLTFRRIGVAAPLPFADDAFDKVFLSEVLQCLSPERRLETLRELRRVLRPGGEFYLKTTVGRVVIRKLLSRDGLTLFKKFAGLDRGLTYAEFERAFFVAEGYADGGWLHRHQFVALGESAGFRFAKSANVGGYYSSIAMEILQARALLKRGVVQLRGRFVLWPLLWLLDWYAPHRRSLSYCILKFSNPAPPG